MLNIFRKDVVFYDLLEQLSAHVLSCAALLRSLGMSFPDDHGEIEKIHAEEHETDEVMRRVLARLATMFLPPIDPEDVHALARELVGIVGAIDAVARRFRMYHVDSVERTFQRQTEVLAQVAGTVNDAVRQLRWSRRLSDLSPTLIEIHRMESVGDDNFHTALSQLFDGSSPVLYVLKWKELHTLVERAIDDCEGVANILERIVLKNA